MATSDPTQILLVHNRWATRNLIESCQALTHEQFHKSFETSLGSLHDTIVHILGAIGGWGDLLADREQGARLESSPERTPAELLVMLDELADDFQVSVEAHPLDGVVSRSRGGQDYAFTRGGVITHVTTHGMHHRAHCITMLRHLGVEALPASAVVEWMLAADSPA
jgi:uncharacterized damage-inducible protein DinB